MSEVGSGKQLRQEQLFVFYVTLVEIQRVIQRAMERSDKDEDDGLLEEVSEHNTQLLKFFFKHLVRTDKGKKAAMDQEDLRTFSQHFNYLRKIFPFL